MKVTYKHKAPHAAEPLAGAGACANLMCQLQHKGRAQVALESVEATKADGLRTLANDFMGITNLRMSQKCDHQRTN